MRHSVISIISFVLGKVSRVVHFYSFHSQLDQIVKVFHCSSLDYTRVDERVGQFGCLRKATKNYSQRLFSAHRSCAIQRPICECVTVHMIDIFNHLRGGFVIKSNIARCWVAPKMETELLLSFGYSERNM